MSGIASSHGQDDEVSPHVPSRIVDRPSYEHFAREDLRAHDLSVWHWWYRFQHPQVHYQRLLRRVEFLGAKHGWVARIRWAFARVRLARESVRTGISIPPGVFGPGLSIAHYGSIVINDQARIGAYCRIHSATNVGTSAGGAPTMGDFVYLGPGAVVHGPVTIGDGVAIGANSVIGKDVPAWTTAVGTGRLLPGSDSRDVMPEWIVPLMPVPRSNTDITANS